MKRTMSRLVLVAAFALLASSCQFYPAAVRSIGVGPPELPWWCQIDPAQAAPGQGDLSNGDCLSLSIQLDLARVAAQRYPTLGDAAAAGLTLGQAPLPAQGSPMFDVTRPSQASFSPARPSGWIYDGTASSAQLAGLVFVVDASPTSPAPPSGFSGANDLWEYVDTGGQATWVLLVWIGRGYEQQPNVFRYEGHPCLAPGVDLTSTTDPCFVQSHPEPFEILVTNDDGVGAPGIDAVVEGLRQLPNVDVKVVAPDGNRSGSGDRTTPGGTAGAPATTASGYPSFAVVGFPADAVLHAIRVLGYNPDIVVSGINEGQNMGPVVALSGTVGAARTAGRNGIPAVGTSQGFQPGVETDYDSGTDATLEWLEDWRLGRADQVVANINIPTCVPPSVIRGTVETVTATAFNGRPYGPANCTSTVTEVPEDMDAFNNGFTSISDVGLGQ